MSVFAKRVLGAMVRGPFHRPLDPDELDSVSSVVSPAASLDQQDNVQRYVPQAVL
jgi:hypothetical protein